MPEFKPNIDTFKYELNSLLSTLKTADHNAIKAYTKFKERWALFFTLTTFIGSDGKTHISILDHRTRQRFEVNPSITN